MIIRKYFFDDSMIAESLRDKDFDQAVKNGALSAVKKETRPNEYDEHHSSSALQSRFPMPIAGIEPRPTRYECALPHQLS